MAAQFQVGEKVAIVKGTYKKQGFAIFKGVCGETKTRCTVRVLDGATSYTRTIHLSSIERINNSTAPTAGEKDKTITMKQSEFLAMKKQVDDLTASVSALKIRLEEVENAKETK